MLQLIHKYQRSLMGLLVIVAIALAMTGFGVDFFGSQNQEFYPIQVGERKVTLEELSNQREQIQEQYRQQWGDNYWRIMEALKINLNQEIVDRVVDQNLLALKAEKLGFAVSDDEIHMFIKRAFGNKEFYDQFLQGRELTAPQFESQLRDQLLSTVLREIVQDISQPTDAEIRALIERLESAYKVAYVSFDPTLLTAEIPDPADDVLSAFYTDRMSDYEQPEKVSYAYVVFKPDAYKDQITDVTEEDIEQYYIEHQNEYKVAPKVKAREIELYYPKEDDPVKMAEVSKVAEEVHGKAVAGEDFVSLVNQYSEDLVTKVSGGDIGWKEKGVPTGESKAFDDAVFAVQGAGVAVLVKNDNGFQIVRIDEYQAERQKELSEVREDIVKVLKNQLAPTFAHDAAQQFVDEATKPGADFEALAQQKGLTVQRTDKPLTSKEDPAGVDKFTRKVLKDRDGEKLLVLDNGDEAVAVKVLEFVDRNVPDFKDLGEVRQQVVADYRAREAKTLADKKAKEFAEKIKQEKKPLREIADASGLKVEEQLSLKRSQGVLGDFAPEPMREALFAVTASMGAPVGPIESQDKYYVFQVENIERPTAEFVAQNIDRYRRQAASELSELIVKSLLTRLKRDEPIQIDPSVLG